MALVIIPRKLTFTGEFKFKSCIVWIFAMYRSLISCVVYNCGRCCAVESYRFRREMRSDSWKRFYERGNDLYYRVIGALGFDLCFPIAGLQIPVCGQRLTRYVWCINFIYIFCSSEESYLVLFLFFLMIVFVRFY